MNKYIITTTISEPTEATIKFSKMEGWTLVVVGDTKTPEKSYAKLDCIYLTPKDQENINKDLSDLIGWGSIQRRNFGFIYAYNQSADIISSVDDDNLPLDNWGKNVDLQGHVGVNNVNCSNMVFDPVSYAGGDFSRFAHRGYPPELFSKRLNSNKFSGVYQIRADIQADLWLGACDIDAYQRMVLGDECWEYDNVFPYKSTKFSPFNSQNTFIHRRVFPYYCVLPCVGRFDDIWASYYCQSRGFHVIYQRPSVVQNRNEHNNITDLSKEVDGYRIAYDLVKELYKNSESIWEFLPKKTKEFFDLYKESFKVNDKI